MNDHQSNDQSPEYSTQFSAEIEIATVSLLWRHSKWLAEFLRLYDPGDVFFQPHLRKVIEAINIAATELGYADWPSVVQVLRELNAIETVGGMDALNAVYSAVEPGPLDTKLFSHYCDMLKRYAVSRECKVPLFRFVRGDFYLERNRCKKNPSAPDFIGSGKYAGRTCRALGYSQDHGIRLSILPE